MISTSSIVYLSVLFGILLANFQYNYHIGNVKFSCIEGNCIYMYANFSDQTNYGWKMENCSIKHSTICETFACLEDYQYRCNDNSKCYPRKGRCDGIQECSDNSDEAGCSKKRVSCGKTLFEEATNEISFEINSAQYASCQWTIRQPVGNKIILTLVNITIRDGDELVISGIQNNTVSNSTSISQMLLNTSTVKAQYISVDNTVIITFRSQNTNLSVANMLDVVLKFSYIARGMYCFLPVIAYGSVVNVTGFGIGHELYFKCHLGYQIPFGQSFSSYCYNGEWTPKPKCQSIILDYCSSLSCGSASVVYNNAILTGYTRNATLYSRALYSCETGLQHKGSSPPFRLCTENGTWSNPDFFCQASLCYATSFAYGHFLDQFYANGTAGKYVCDEGFYQKDIDPLCISGRWKGVPYCYPEYYCYYNSCGNGTCVKLIGGYSCLCYEGFQMISTTKGYTCSDIDECSTPGYSLCEFTCVNTIGSYECRCPDTHWLYTDPNSVNNLVSNTEFLIPNRTCIEKRCPAPEIPPNVIPYPLYTDPFSYHNGLVQIGTIVYFACDHSAHNYTSFICDKTESWVMLNDCLDVTCKPLEITKQNLMIWPIKKSYKFKDKIYFFCDEFYELNGPSSSYCIDVDKWSLSKLPDCIVRQCPGLQLDDYETIPVNNKQDITEDHLRMFFESATHIKDTPGYSLFIKCKNGANFANGQTKIFLLCMQNYTWNLDSIPACIHQEDIQRNYSDNGDAMIKKRYSKNCIRNTTSDIHVAVNTSAMLWCFLSAKCTNITLIKWYRDNRQNISGMPLKGENDSWGLFFESVKVIDDGRYYCVALDTNNELLEKHPVDLFVYQTFETGRSWPDIVQNSEPVKDLSDNLFQKEICSRYSNLFVGIRGDFNSVIVENVKIYTIKCPEVRVSFAFFPETTAAKDGSIVSGRCLHGAHTNIKGQHPQLFCTQHGKWIYNAQSANLCFCSANYTSENDACVERGEKLSVETDT
ncbi:unnamed protein product [Brugia timori]|uniref:EGF-like domain-containing protein n=1 Tax=Brugia timori TaxID=42155 RepID=A0A0R3QLM2_9BILA|nr:unnamed protein product [Brugia timori]